MVFRSTSMEFPRDIAVKSAVKKKQKTYVLTFTFVVIQKSI